MEQVTERMSVAKALSCLLQRRHLRPKDLHILVGILYPIVHNENDCLCNAVFIISFVHVSVFTYMYVCVFFSLSKGIHEKH